MTEAKRGFFPFIIGDEVSLEQGGALVLAAKDNLSVSQGGGQIVGAGNNVSVSQGGSWVMGAGNTISVHQGGGAIVAARNVTIDRSFLGIALGRVSIRDSRVLLASPWSVFVGSILGLVIGFAVGCLWRD